jgi:hypothetical protein
VVSVEPTACVHCCSCLICHAATDLAVIHYHQQINLLLSRLTEPQRRWYVGTLAQAPDHPSIRTLVAITGLSSNTIIRGRREIESGFADLPSERQRRGGGGQPAAEKKIRRSKR